MNWAGASVRKGRMYVGPGGHQTISLLPVHGHGIGATWIVDAQQPQTATLDEWTSYSMGDPELRLATIVGAHDRLRIAG